MEGLALLPSPPNPRHPLPGPRQVVRARERRGNQRGCRAGEVDPARVPGTAQTHANFAGCVVGLLSAHWRGAGGCGQDPGREQAVVTRVGPQTPKPPARSLRGRRTKRGWSGAWELFGGEGSPGEWNEGCGTLTLPSWVWKGVTFLWFAKRSTRCNRPSQEGGSEGAMGGLIALPIWQRTHPWLDASPRSALGAQHGDLWRLPDGELGDGGAPRWVRRRPGQQREAWTEEELRGAGDSGARGQFPRKPSPRAAGDATRGPWGTRLRTATPVHANPRLGGEPAPTLSRQPSYSGNPLPQGDGGFLESPGFPRPPCRLSFVPQPERGSCAEGARARAALAWRWVGGEGWGSGATSFL